MKKKLLVISLVLLITVVAVCLLQERESSVMVAGQEKYNSIKEKTASLEEEFALSFNGEELPFDAATKTFYLPVDMEDDQWEVGNFGGAFGKNERADLFFLQDYRDSDKKQAIAEGKAFPFLAVNGKGYGEYRLVFTGMPMMSFTSTEYLAEDGTPMFLVRLFDTHHEGEWVIETYTQSRLRGNTSMNYEKKSLRLNLKDLEKDGTFTNQDENFLGLRDDNDWILNSLYGDNTRIRDQLCIDLWNEVGATSNPYGQNYGTEAAYVEVLINNGYQGLYSLMVPIDRKQLGMDSVSRQLAAGETVVERIYKKRYVAEWNAADYAGPLMDANMPDYRGGFYLKGDTLLQNEEEWEPLHRLATLMEAEDAVFLKDITTNVNQQNVIENWLFYQAIAGFDNENKNYYYIARNNNGSYLGYFVPWDMNISFGMVYADNPYFAEETDKITNQMVVWEPGQRMIELNVENSRQLASVTWQRWRQDVFSDEALKMRIADLEHQVKDSGAFERESNRWPNGNQNGDFTYIYTFTKARMESVDRYIESLEEN